MMQNFTISQSVLIKYLYGECSIEESIDVTENLITDKSLEKEFNQLNQVKKMLNSLNELSPAESSIEKIEKYSKSVISD